MKWPWSKSDFTENSVVVTRAELGTLLDAQCPGAWVDDEYDRFLLMDYERVKGLVFKNWDSSYISYGFDAPDFPLCYDYAELCAAKIREMAVRENFVCRPAFGTVRYTRKDGGRHAICFVVVSDKRLHFFEPQQADVRWMDTPEGMKSIENLYI